MYGLYESQIKCNERSGFGSKQTMNVIEVCGPCGYRGIQTEARKYCKSCQEAQCKDCAEVHKSSKATRNHFLVDIGKHEPVSKLSRDIEDLQICSEHADRQLEFYCCEHGALLCSMCMFVAKRHSNCANIVDIKSAGEYIVKHELSKRLLECLTELKQQSDGAVIKIKEVIETSKHGTSIVHDQLKTVRQKLLQIFQRQAEVITQKVLKKYERHRSKCAIQLEGIETLVSSIEHCSELYTSVLQIGDYDEVFRCVLSLQDQIEEFGQEVTKANGNVFKLELVIKETDFLKVLDIENKPLITCSINKENIDLFDRCSLAKSLRDDFKKAVNECSVQHRNSPQKETDKCKTASLPEGEKTNGQRSQMANNLNEEIMVSEHNRKVPADYRSSSDVEESKVMPLQSTIVACSPKPVTFTDKKALRKQDFDVQVTYLRSVDIQIKDMKSVKFGGIISLEDNRLILSDLTNSRLLILSDSHNAPSEVQTKSPPGSMALLDKHTLAVCMMKTNAIFLLDITQNDWTGRYFQTKYQPKNIISVSSDKMLVAMCEWDGGWHFELLSRQGVTCKSIKLENVYDGHRIAIQKNIGDDNDFHIVIFCEMTNSLKCFQSNGQIKFSYKIDKCSNVLTDKYGYIFIIRYTGEVQVLTPSGLFLTKQHYFSMHTSKFASFNAAFDKLNVLSKKSQKIHILHVIRKSL